MSFARCLLRVISLVPVFLLGLRSLCDYSAGNKLTFGKGTRVLVKPDTDNSKSWPTLRPAEDSVVYSRLLGGSERASKRGMCRASFHCAHQAGRTLTFVKGAVVSVSSNIQDPKPAVYQLRDAQAKNSTICLFTDFGSHINISDNVPPDVFVSNNNVLDMRSMDSKSNGAIAWSKNSSLNCKDAFRQHASYPSSDVPCDARLIEKSFETDMNLNFQNLSVMGLRILLLKVAGFNLLMTLRLWSS